MLVLHDLVAGYGYNTVLHGISLTTHAGGITSLIGANGAGKTTMLRSIVNVVHATSGTIELAGQSIVGLRPEAILQKGVSLVPEGRRIFEGLTVTENLRMGGYICPSRNELARRMEDVFALFPRLHERRAQMGSSLSGGEQQMLAIGRSLMSKPRVLLLDEPSMGLAPQLVDQVFAAIMKLRVGGTSVLLVEQHARRALEIADYAYVLESGRVVLEGEGRALLGESRVIAAYLGES